MCIIQTVAVGSDIDGSRLLMPLPLVFTYGFLPRAVVSGFFIVPTMAAVRAR